MAGHPHFMSAHVTNSDIFRSHHLTQIVDQFLWLDRKTRIIGIGFVIGPNFRL